jgi:hypothetical protein
VIRSVRLWVPFLPVISFLGRSFRVCDSFESSKVENIVTKFTVQSKDIKLEALTNGKREKRGKKAYRAV